MAGKSELIVRELLASRLTEFPGLGSVGASIFLREVQDIWSAVAPYVDAKVTSGAHRVRLPGDRESLAGLLASSGQPARLAAARITEPAGRQRGYRFRARLIPVARYTTETYRMRPDASLARFVCSE